MLKRVILGFVLAAGALPAAAQVPPFSMADAVALGSCEPRLADIVRQAEAAGEVVTQRHDTTITTMVPATTNRPRFRREVMCVFTIMGPMLSVTIAETYTAQRGR